MAGVILYIDDAPELPEGFAESLRREGYELAHAADAEEAVQLVAERRPALVLMELLLTGCDGLDLLEGIRERSPDLPVVVLTRAARLPGLYGQAVALGVADFLSKPVLASQLLISVREFAAPPPTPAQVELDESTSGESAGVPAGDLAALPFPELLQDLYRGGATGVLIASRGARRVGVQLRNGSPVGVGTGRSREGLADFLLRRGELSRSQHQRVSDRAAQGAESALEILVGAGLLSEEQVEAAARRQARELFFEPFGWTEGRFRFADGRRLRADSVLELDAEPTRLLLDAALQAVPDATIRERMRKLGSLYVIAAESAAGPELAPGQARRLAELAGSESLAELLEQGELDARLLYGLWLAGRISFQRQPVLMLVDELSGEDEADDTLEVPAASRDEDPLGSLDPETALRRLAGRVLGNDDFHLLQVSAVATEGQRRAACDRLLAQIPPGMLHSPDPELRRLAIQVRDRIEEAYENLKDPETRRAYAVLQHEGRRDRDGGADAERALEAESWFRKGNGFLKRKRYDEAVEAFGMAAHLDPDEGEYLSHLGYAMYLSNPHQDVVQREAMEHIANGIKRSPDRELSYVFLGRLLRGKGDVETARKVLRKALRINPDCHQAHQELRLLDLREQKGQGLLGRLWRR